MGAVRTLSALLTQAVEDNLLPGNPAQRLGRYLRAGDEETVTVDPLTSEEVATVLDIARAHFPHWYTWMLCAVNGPAPWRTSRSLAKADLQERGPHQLRHTYASLLLKAGADHLREPAAGAPGPVHHIEVLRALVARPDGGAGRRPLRSDAS